MEEADRENGADRHPLEGTGREEGMVSAMLLQKLVLYKKQLCLIFNLVNVHCFGFSMNWAAERPCINYIYQFSHLTLIFPNVIKNKKMLMVKIIKNF